MVDGDAANGYAKRAEAYRLLGAMFVREPGIEEAQSFLSFGWEDVGCHFDGVDGSDLEKLVRENRAEFARLFIGPKRLEAPPYESVYRTGTRGVRGEISKSVRECYARVGVQANATVREPDDFIGFELQFASALLFAAHVAEEKGDLGMLQMALDAYRTFFFDHMAEWILLFCNDVESSSSRTLTGFAARALRNTILNESVLLGL